MAIYLLTIMCLRSPARIIHLCALVQNIYLQLTPGNSNTDISKYFHIKEYRFVTVFNLLCATPFTSNYLYLKVNFLEQKIYFEISVV